MIVGIFGTTGSGKSTLFKRIVRAARRAIVVDPLSEHADLGVCPRTVEEFRDYWRRNRNAERWKIVLQPIVIDGRRDPSEVLDPYLSLIARGGREYILAVDEVDTFVSLHGRHPDISTVVNYGRHWGIHLVAVARRTQAVPAEIIAQCSDLYVFRMTRPGDVDYLEPYVGPDIASRIRTLQTWECIHWQTDGTVGLIRVSPS